MTVATSTIWLTASAAFLVLLLIAGLLTLRGTTVERVVALQLSSTLSTITLVVLAEAFNRDVYFDLAVVDGAMSFVGVLFYLRTLERWT